MDREQVQEVRVGFDPRILVQGKVDVLAVFKSNEPDTIRKLGFDVVQFDPAAYGVPALGLTYITREELIAEEPELIARFLKAALEGAGVLVCPPRGDARHRAALRRQGGSRPQAVHAAGRAGGTRCRR